MKIRMNKDGSIDRYKATFYEDEVLTIAHCLNFVMGLAEEAQRKGSEPFLTESELDRVIDVTNKCNSLIAELPKEEDGQSR